MSRKRRRRSGRSGWYCKICGEFKANERFSGKGHARHICKDCAGLPPERREELMTINRIEDLPYHLSREQRAWLDGMRSDSRPAVSDAAVWAYEARYSQKVLDDLPDEDWFAGDWADDEEWEDEEDVQAF